jgi:hypothetical protein
MNKMFVVALAVALDGPPALSAPTNVEYTVMGSATGTEPQSVTQDTPDSITGGGNAIGYAGSFTANATNINGGSVTAFASEGISDVDDFNKGGLGTTGGVSSGGFASVQYTIEVVGPTTGVPVPVHITMNLTAGSIEGIPASIGGVNAPIIANAQAQADIQYEGAGPVGTPGTLAYANVDTHYNYNEPNPVLVGYPDPFDQEVTIESGFAVNVLLYANVGAQYTGSTAIDTETVEVSASADPTFSIDEPGYSAYSIEGVPAGPAAATTPEPSTWAMMLIGFAGLGYAGYRRSATRHTQF